MKKIAGLLFTAFFTLAGSVTPNVAQPLGSSSPATDSRESGENLPRFAREQVLQDFQIARQALEEGHMGIYRFTPKPEMDRIFDRAVKSINGPMNAFEFYRLLVPAVAAIKCGHTAVYLPESVEEEIRTRTPLLPLRVRVLDQRVYVFRDLSSKSGTLAGKEILSVNDVPISQVLKTMMEATMGDGDVQTSRQLTNSGWRFAEQLVTLMGLNSPYRLSLHERGSVHKETVLLNGVAFPLQRALWQAQYPQDQPPGLIAELQYYDDNKIARLSIRNFEGFADLGRHKPLEDFFKEAFAQLQTKRSKTLIIDVRNNGGGSDHLGALLLSYLLEKPFDYYADLVMTNRTYDFMKYDVSNEKILENFLEKKADGKYHLTGHPVWGRQYPNKPTFTGKAYILINGGSFSTTAEFITQAHFYRRATFIGEESGDGYYGSTSGWMPRVALPNTKLMVRIPLVAYRMAATGYPRPSHGLLPDYPTTYSIEELIAGRDKEMELAVKLARRGKN